MNVTSNLSFVEYLHMDMCHMIDLPAGGKDCSQEYPQFCIECKIPAKYFTGEKLSDFNSTGHIICLSLGILTVAIGILGMFTNSIIITVIKNRKKYQPFDFLIMALACVDLYSCGAVLIAQLARMALYESWANKGYSTFQWFMASSSATLFGRTLSTYMTLLITTERFCIMTFPFQSKSWFTYSKTKLLTLAVIFVSILLNVPRFVNYKVTRNNYVNDNEIASVRGYEFLVRTTSGYVLFYQTLGELHATIDFWVPLPILLLFNFLSFLQARKIVKERKRIRRSQKKEIEALKLFLPVVVALMATNIVPFIHFTFIKLTHTFYRELSTALMFAIAINSAVNFHLYYYQSSTFKRETNVIFLKLRGVEIPEDNDSERQKQSTTSDG